VSFVKTAIVGSSLIKGFLGGKASDKSDEALGRATDLTVEESARQYDQTRTDFAPWRTSGAQALNRLDTAMSGDQSGFTTSAGYNFVRDEGLRDTENRFSVGGGGGNAMRALAEFNSGLASTEYGNWFDRNLRMSGQGVGATGATAIAGDRSAGRIGSAYMQRGYGEAANERSRYENINNAMQGGISNWLYAKKAGLFEDDDDRATRPIYGGP